MILLQHVQCKFHLKVIAKPSTTLDYQSRTLVHIGSNFDTALISAVSYIWNVHICQQIKCYVMDHNYVTDMLVVTYTCRRLKSECILYTFTFQLVNQCFFLFYLHVYIIILPMKSNKSAEANELSLNVAEMLYTIAIAKFVSI